MTVNSELTADVLVIGAGRSADRLVTNLNHRRVSVILSAPGAVAEAGFSSDLTTVLPETRVSHASGGPGDFRVHLDNSGQRIGTGVKQIVVAQDNTPAPCFQRYGLTPGKAVLSLTEAAAPDGGGATGRIVFLVGLATDSDTVVTRRVMSAALALNRGQTATVYILTRNLKVADTGLEALFRETKAAGVTYVKFTRNDPVIVQEQSGKVTLSFDDEITGQPFRLTPEVVVVDEEMLPSPHLSTIGERFKLHADAAGFLQKENVHREGVFTNRRGIFVIGPARGVFAPAAQMADADDAALLIDRFLRGIEDPRLPAAEIDRGRCVKCLTCYRLCPYGAIHLETVRPIVMPAACESCGLCMAECPKEAIRLAPLERSRIEKQMLTGDTAAAAPAIIAFCCSRSAAHAARAAAAAGAGLPAGLRVIEVPCAGGICLQHILAAFEKHADGVLVLACHMDNCHSENGNRFARTRVTQLQGELAAIGLNAERLAFHTLASNMAGDFAAIVNTFEAALNHLGPIGRKQN